jgi:membrane protease YdiL (CAAX protease family)
VQTPINYFTNIVRNYQNKIAMQNIEKESHSWLKLIVIFLWLFLYGLASVLSTGDDININANNPSVVALLYIGQVIGVIILFIAPATLFAIFWTKQRIHYLGITTRPKFRTLIIGVLGILLALPLINWLADINQHMHLPSAFSEIETWMKNTEAKATEMTDIFTKGTSLSRLILNLFVIAFMAAFSEELFFRGLLQKVLIESFKNKHIGIWIGAFIFSAFHMQFYGFIPRMLMGAYLGYLFAWSGSIWPGMIAHFINNGAAVFLTWLINRGTIAPEIDKIGITSDQLILVFTSIIMVSMSLLLVYRIEKKKVSDSSI